jgi:hypothetical protein
MASTFTGGMPTPLPLLAQPSWPSLGPAPIMAQVPVPGNAADVAKHARALLEYDGSSHRLPPVVHTETVQVSGGESSHRLPLPHNMERCKSRGNPWCSLFVAKVIVLPTFRPLTA